MPIERGDWQWAPHYWVRLSPTSINQRAQKHLDHHDQQSLTNMLAELGRGVAKVEASRQYQAVVFIERTLRADPLTHELRVVDRAIHQSPLPGAVGGGCADRDCRREGATLLR